MTYPQFVHVQTHQYKNLINVERLTIHIFTISLVIVVARSRPLIATPLRHECAKMVQKASSCRNMSVKINDFSMKLPAKWTLPQVNVYKSNSCRSSLASPGNIHWRMLVKPLYQVSCRDREDNIYTYCVIYIWWIAKHNYLNSNYAISGQVWK